MKKLLIAAAAVFASLNIYAQGTVNFANNAATAVTNNLTGAKVITGTTFQSFLYYAQDTGGGVPEESAFITLGNSAGFSPVAGLITGGTRTTPNTTVGGTAAYFQIRTWEVAYGTSFENLVAQQTVIGGRKGLAGKSNIVRVTTGDPLSSPPGTPGSLITSGLQGYYLNVVPEPSVIGLGLLGAGALLFLRRRK